MLALILASSWHFSRTDVADSPLLGCEARCQSAERHCAFVDHAPCLETCAAKDGACRDACAAEKLACSAQCDRALERGCEHELGAVFGCVVLACGDPSRDVWAECSRFGERYEACLHGATTLEPPDTH